MRLRYSRETVKKTRGGNGRSPADDNVNVDLNENEWNSNFKKQNKYRMRNEDWKA